MGLSDRYEILDLVVQDESGVTFLARDRTEDQEVALRRFFPAESPGNGFDEEGKAAFAGVVEALRQVRHPSLCGVLDGGVDRVDGIPYLVTEWAHGERLSELLEAGSLAAEQAVAVAGQGLEVLEVLRQRFGEGADWLEMEAASVLVNAETGVCSFMICPLQVLGVASRDGGLTGLGHLVELAMGWEGQAVPPGAAAGLGGWVLAAKSGSCSVAEAIHELVKIRSVWTGEQAPEPVVAQQRSAAPQLQLNTPGTAGPAQSAAVAAPPRVYSAPKQSKGGLVAALLFFGVLFLGVGVWLGVKQPWVAAQKKSDSQAVARAGQQMAAQRESAAMAESATKTAPLPVPSKPTSGLKAGEKEPSAPKSDKETAQERINRIARETSEAMGIDAEKSNGDRVMPSVFGPDDGAAMRNWMDEEVVLEGVLFRVRDSRSGKTRYLEFSDEVGIDVICARCWPNEGDLDLGSLKGLEGKKLRFKGKVVEEGGTGRVVVQIDRRDQIEEVEG